MEKTDTLSVIAAGVIIGAVIPEPYIWYVSVVLALVVIFLVVQMIVVLVRTDPSG